MAYREQLQPAFNMKFLSCIVTLILCISGIDASAQSIQLGQYATIGGGDTDAEFGRTVRYHSGSGQIFIGAPGYDNERGAIFRYSGTLDSDTLLTDDHIVLTGTEEGERLGENFILASLTNDNLPEIVVAEPRALSDSGRVVIYYQDSNKSFESRPFVTIHGVRSERFGTSMAEIDYPESVASGNGLIIGASAYDGFKGRAYIFNQLSSFPAIGEESVYSSTSLASHILQGTRAFELFGATVKSLRIDDDDSPDFIVSATKSNAYAQLAGISYLFLGVDLDGEQVMFSEGDAISVIGGRTNNTLYAGRIFDYGDINQDGFDEFGLVSDGDQNGRMALYEGRENWPDSTQIGVMPPNGAQHKLLGPNSTKGFGFSTDFNGDFNFDAQRDLVVGAPYTGENVGRVLLFNQNGQLANTINAPTNRILQEFGTSVTTVDNLSTLTNIDPYEIDDLLIGAPGAVFSSPTRNISSGVVYVYTGRLNPPTANLAIRPSIINEIGDSVEVVFAVNKGSRPIEVNKYYTTVGTGNSVVRDSTILSNSTTSTRVKFGADDDTEVQLTYTVRDNLGAGNSISNSFYFAAYPEPFDLLSDLNNSLLEIEGEGTQTVRFESEASADTNGRTINYDLLISRNAGDFEKGSGFSLYKRQSSPVFKLSLQEINTLLINNGFVNLNTPGEIYYSIRARNYRGSQALLSTMPTSVHDTLSFVRRGLDPYFQFTKNAYFVNIEGFDTDGVGIEWSGLITENPNASISYKFELYDTNKPDAVRDTLISDLRGNSRSINLSFGLLDSLLEEKGLKETARADTVHWGYTVEAIIDDDESQTWFPNQGVISMDIIYTVLLSSNEDEVTEVIDETVPTKFELYPNYPNPFNPSTQLKFALPEPRQVRIVVFNILGQLVYSWQSSGMMNTGFHNHEINAGSWSSGIYIYQVHAGKDKSTGKMSLIK